MKLDLKYKPELLTSVEREHLLHVNFNAAKKRLEATDGVALCVVPCEPEKGDASGLIQNEALELARDGGSAIACSEKTLSLRDGDLVLKRAKLDPSDTYPPVDRVIPGNDTEFAYSIGIDVKKLADCAEAIGARRVWLRFRSPMDGILITDLDFQSEARAVLMPCQVKP